MPDVSRIHFEAICRMACALFGVPAAGIHLDDGTSILAGVADGLDAAARLALAGQADVKRSTLWIADASQDRAFAPLDGVLAAPGLRFLASAPFGPGGIGRIVLCDTRAHEASAEAMQRLEDLRRIAEQCLRLQIAVQTAQEQASLFRQLTETSTDTIVLGDLDGNRLYISPSVRDLLGYEPDEMVGEKAIDITHPDDRPAFGAMMERIASGQLTVATIEIRQRHKNGSWIWMEASVRHTFEQATHRPNGYVSTVRKTEHRKRREERLERLASHDGLTGLPNRTLFERYLRRAVLRACGGAHRIALFYMDLDRFKEVNDRLGHAAGDVVLREVATRLRDTLRTGDFVARLGGDEFTAILEVGRREAEHLAGRLIVAINRPIRCGDADISVGLSVGIACAPEDGRDPDALSTSADQALYRAKAAGRNLFRSFGE